MTRDEGRGEPGAPLDQETRAARIALVRETLQSCVDELDALGLWQAGAHASMAVSALGGEG